MAEDRDKIQIDDDFDYQKEIEEIEAQERELARRRAQKQKELEQRRLAREKQLGQHKKEDSDKESAKKARKEESRKEKELRERRRESEWLGEPFDDEEDVVAVSSGSSGRGRKKSHKGLAAALAVLLIAALAGGVYAFKLQADKKAVSDFEAKVSAFQTDKLDGANLGSDSSFFDDFINQCKEAVASGDLAKIKELNGRWSEVEKRLSEDESGKASVDAFVKTANETLSKYQSTDDTKTQYDEFMKKMKAAQDSADFSQIESLQTELDALTTAMKAADIKAVQELKNSVSDLEIDKEYVTDDEQKELDDFKKATEDAEKDGDYATAIATLKKWYATANEISSSIASQKKEAATKAASEAQAAQNAQAQQARAQAAAEAKAESIAESKKAEARQSGTSSGSGGSNKTTASTAASSSGSSNKSSGVNSYSQLTGDYVISDSSSRYLQKSELSGLSALQLKVARNEIYARHGRKFDDKDLRDYFNSKSWYRGTVEPGDFSVAVFNEYEKQNIMLINDYENGN